MSMRWHCFFINAVMKTTCFILSILFFLSWVFSVFLFRAGLVIHIMILLAALFWLQGIILIGEKKSRV
jgi:hypothetical protein